MKFIYDFYNTGYFKMMWYVTTRVVMLPLPFRMIDCLDDVFAYDEKWISTIIDSHFTHRGNIKPPQVFAWHLWFSIRTGVEKLTFASVICPYRGKDFLCVGSFDSKWETMLFCYPAKPRSLFRLKTRQLDIIKTLNLWGEKRPTRDTCCYVTLTFRMFDCLDDVFAYDENE